ncbi:hypothetical protein M1293_00195 [Candidatus Parvarchaeota archaeon]|nr:hypothetical protein [Candidatus Parvarchaeota archaeon]
MKKHKHVFFRYLKFEGRELPDGETCYLIKNRPFKKQDYRRTEKGLSSILRDVSKSEKKHQNACPVSGEYIVFYKDDEELNYLKQASEALSKRTYTLGLEGGFVEIPYLNHNEAEALYNLSFKSLEDSISVYNSNTSTNCTRLLVEQYENNKISKLLRADKSFF